MKQGTVVRNPVTGSFTIRVDGEDKMVFYNTTVRQAKALYRRYNGLQRKHILWVEWEDRSPTF